MNRFQYFIRGVKNIKTKGTIAPTSKFTCKKMTQYVDFESAYCIVELGAGDGRITKHILAQMRPDAVLISFEIDKKFCRLLEEIDDPRLVVISDSAEYLVKYLKQNELQQADYIISGLPFVMLPDELGEVILLQTKEALRPGGSFIQFHYSMLYKKHYNRLFESVDVKLEVRNLPPAFVFVCQ